jgi:hypothetical protein
MWMYMCGGVHKYIYPGRLVVEHPVFVLLGHTHIYQGRLAVEHPVVDGLGYIHICVYVYTRAGW